MKKSLKCSLSQLHLQLVCFMLVSCFSAVKSQEVRLGDIVCYVNATSLKLKDLSQIYGKPFEVGNSTLDITGLSNLMINRQVITMGLGLKIIKTNLLYSTEVNDSYNDRYYAASKINIKNKYLMLPIAYELTLFNYSNELDLYCRPSACLNLIASNKRLFYRTNNYKYAEKANEAFEVLNKTKFGSFVDYSIALGVNVYRKRFIFDFGFKINAGINHLYGELAGAKPSFGGYFGCGYKINWRL